MLYFRNVLQIMSSGYNSKVLTFPGLKLQELLFYKDISKIQVDCKLFGLTFTNENVLFQKSQFNEQVLLVSTKFTSLLFYAKRRIPFYFIIHFLYCRQVLRCITLLPGYTNSCQKFFWNVPLTMNVKLIFM